MLDGGGQAMDQMKWTDNPFFQEQFNHPEKNFFTKKETRSVGQFHASMPDYARTPLVALSNLATSLGVKEIYVKNEAERFGLNAFKGLGASYAMASYFAKELGLDPAGLCFSTLIDRVAEMPVRTIATVTAGNHGKGVAWAARLLNQRAHIYMPKGTSESRVQAIEQLGAAVFVTKLNYDDTVTYVAGLAEKHGWILMQDTAWTGYEEIPRAIMQGYTTIVGEIIDQLEDETFQSITHVILQAGVGSFAAAIAAVIHQASNGNPPKMIIAEPSNADTFYQSATHPSGKVQRVLGDLETMMAGLACGEASPLGWRILQQVSDSFMLCDDSVSANGMRVLASPVGEDASMIAGESGALPIGVLYEIMANGNANEMKQKLQLDHTARVLVINTEGDTDPENYRKIVGG